ncbi:hypothetical protein JO972_16665 [Verrucomicrobiaceae bacterium 5K15]|uniref:Uncharacterized protein n=1 Tax=Oceaniferula flava TaxID=2800421 RepID=A0AAE2SGS5_9BACT|nr:hypothetical protein [Oceaniferula flavus]MBK1856599.1 hypothetical protein [Oceaniferula flavus]MBM1137907.1 hypothetical protein [Oceaniferula flavus]
MKLVEDNFRDAVLAHKSDVLEELGRSKPKKVVALLEHNGWPREWACNIVAGMEKKYNPANLKWGPEENQRLREKYSSRVFIGGAILLVGSIVTILSLVLAFSFGGLGIVAYGAILWGGGTFWSGISNVGSYPDREIPIYKSPEVKVEGHVPDTY